MSSVIMSANERQVKRAAFAVACLSLFVAVSLLFVNAVCRNFDNGSSDAQVQHQNHKLFAPTTDQPFYVLLTPDGHALAPSRSYNEDVKQYTDWLDNGLSRFRAE